MQAGHGGNIYTASEELGIAAQKIIDFSASINPLGVSKEIRSEIKKYINSLIHYPDPEAAELRERLGEYHRIDPESIICGNGSTELIYLIARVLKPERLLMPQPTFSDYERACRTSSYELRVMSYELRKEDNFDIRPDEFISAMTEMIQSTEHRAQNTDKKNSKDSLGSGLWTLGSVFLAFLCNPNNPTGRLLAKDDVLKIAEAAKKVKCYLVVDEAFIDFSPEESVIRYVKDNPYLIVLRSMTKFYAIPGLRIGYGVFPLHLTGALRGMKEPWTVNMLAQKAAVMALEDASYREASFALIKREKKFLEEGFKKSGIEFFPSEANFYLLRIDGAENVYETLRKKGILIRKCANFYGLDSSYIRVAVKSRKANKLLLRELSLIADNVPAYQAERR
ncbi:MAG: threonine-phosphate decarboxylase [Nitrospirae bacterium]|nr:threonine-phosphate decarboxylase [Nitrospirota bacterium]